MYSSRTGSFCSRDPIGYGDGVLLYANRFGLSKTDPSGLSSRTVTQSEVAAGCDLMVRCTATDFIFEHCGLSIRLDNGRVIHIDGTRGNDVEVIDDPRMPRPSDIEARTRISGKNCACLINSGIGWGGTPSDQRSRNHITRNSNWVLKCVMKKCSMGVNWGRWIDTPVGWDGDSTKCSKYGYVYSASGNCPTRGCVAWQECPDGYN